MIILQEEKINSTKNTNYLQKSIKIYINKLYLKLKNKKINK